MLKIYCPMCREIFRETDFVLLDFINTITHVSCYTGSYEFIHDKGTFKELVEKYAFLKSFLH